MTNRPRQDARLLVVVEAREAAIEAVEYAVREARDRGAETGGPVAVEVWVLGSADRPDAAEDTRARLADAVSTLDAGEAVDVAIDRRLLTGRDPDARTDELLASLRDRRFERLVIEADTELSVGRLRERIGLATVELAPVERRQPRRPLHHRGGIRRTAAVFGLTYLFYLAVGGFVGGADLVTGAISAAVVAVVLSSVAFSEAPRLSRTGPRLVRLVAVLPVLLWEIAKANVAIAALILHPRLPIDPAVETVETETRGGLERMVLATVVALTPGTLPVDVRGRTFTFHSLSAGARRDLASGRLERLIAWVFRGRRAAGGDEG